jgi:hypothetical protein
MCLNLLNFPGYFFERFGSALDRHSIMDFSGKCFSFTKYPQVGTGNERRGGEKFRGYLARNLVTAKRLSNRLSLSKRGWVISGTIT